MKTNTKKLHTEAGALQNIVDWSTQRPMWQRDALRRLCHKSSLSLQDFEELLKIAKGDETNAHPLEKKHLPSPDAAAKTINLKSIRDTEHVNALEPGEHLITVSDLDHIITHKSRERDG